MIFHHKLQKPKKKSSTKFNDKRVNNLLSKIMKI